MKTGVNSMLIPAGGSSTTNSNQTAASSSHAVTDKVSKNVETFSEHVRGSPSPEIEKEDEENKDSVSETSDLYLSQSSAKKPKKTE